MSTVIATVLVNREDKFVAETAIPFNVVLWDKLSEFKSEEQLKRDVTDIASMCAFLEEPINSQLN